MKKAIYLFLLLLLVLLCLLLKNKRPNVCVAHRGFHHDGIIENSLDSVEAAFDKGIGGVEFDLRQTFDGKVLLAHDRSLSVFRDQAGCPSNKFISEVNANDIVASCRFLNGNSYDFFEQVVNLVRLGKYRSRPILFVELKDSWIGKELKRLLIELAEIYPTQRLRYISFDPYLIEKLEAISELREVKKLLLSSTFPLFRGTGILVGSRKDNRLMKLRYLDFQVGEVGVWFNESSSVMKEDGTYSDQTLADLCHFLKMEIDFLITDQPLACTNIRKNLPDNCSSFSQ